MVTSIARITSPYIRRNTLIKAAKIRSLLIIIFCSFLLILVREEYGNLPYIYIIYNYRNLTIKKVY
nr:MAG TPA: hypothetical protein [Caudoviricetes sp.]